jgi:hypothetical protein
MLLEGGGGRGGVACYCLKFLLLLRFCVCFVLLPAVCVNGGWGGLGDGEVGGWGWAGWSAVCGLLLRVFAGLARAMSVRGVGRGGDLGGALAAGRRGWRLGWVNVCGVVDCMIRRFQLQG